MKRNLTRTAAEGREIIKANSRLDLTATDLQQLYSTITGAADKASAIFEAIGTAYRAGVAVGSRQGKREQAACR